MPIKGVRYRYKKGTHIRLAFRGNKVVEAKNTKTGATHTPAEFAADRKRRRTKKPTKGHRTVAMKVATRKRTRRKRA